ncbi:MAG: tRNA lysidine(34) synthetase TilS [Gammaproteobacteria bacterium]|nr:tRNA lysidine(34) synthetase TilS [Gammaproteobacteria bacterium]
MIVWVAYSGGVDSHVLLHALVSLRQHYKFTLRAIHIHHGLNAKASDWQRHCELVCQTLDVELSVHALNMSPSQENLEACARELRYHYFSSLLQSGDYLLTGHHQDDQAETVVLQLLRGAGPKGMSAMPASSVLGQGMLLRPFLNISRAELVEYAKQHQLIWIDDDSNQNTRFSRNFIRHEIMPLLKQRWPSAVETIARSAKHCAESEKIVDEYTQPLFNQCVLANNALSVTQLKNLTPIQQKHVVRHWLSYLNYSLPNEDKLANLLHVFLTAHQDKNPMITWGAVEVRRYQDALIAMPVQATHDASQVFSWNLQSDLRIESLGIILQAVSCVGSGIKFHSTQNCEIRFRQGDERVYLAYRKGGRSLKKCFQEWHVPVWERDRVPLLYIDNQLAVIIGYGVCEGFLASGNENGLIISAIKEQM